MSQTEGSRPTINPTMGAALALVLVVGVVSVALHAPGDFMPHGYCYRWIPGLVWLHGVSDALIFLAYTTIPITLIHIVRRRKDLPFNWIFVCFGVFIVACGLTHAIEVWNLWHAMYWLAGAVKAVTAVASIGTAILLVRLVPHALTLPSTEDLHEAHRRATTQDAALVASEAKFRGILESAPDVVVIAGAEGRIVLVNTETERLFGYRREELLGQPVEILVPERFRGRHPRHREGYAAHPHTRSMGEGLELSGLRKDGSEFPVEIGLSPIYTPEGTLISSAIRDVTKRKGTENALRASEAKFRGFLESAPDAMVIVDAGGQIVLINTETERLFGYSRDGLLGKQVVTLIPEGFTERLLADALRSTEDAMTQRIGTGIELHGRRENGSQFPIEIMLSPLGGPDGVLVSVAIRDITARKGIEDRLVRTVRDLKRSNDELQQFASVASHDLQEPLRMVASFTQLLAKRYTGRLDAVADGFIGHAVDGCNRMQALIHDLLAYSRAGTEGKAIRDISSELALNEALSNLRAAIEESHAVVTFDPLPTVRMDDRQLAQLFQNLVGNAIKYRGAEIPRVHVSVATNRAREQVFSVRDNGLGIEAQYFERIFVLFQRLHGRKEFQGTGIGLAVCKKIVDRLGGRIWVESQTGNGSTFHFALPERGSI